MARVLANCRPAAGYDGPRPEGTKEELCSGGCGTLLLVSPTSAAIEGVMPVCDSCVHKFIKDQVADGNPPQLAIAPGAFSPDNPLYDAREQRRLTSELLAHGFVKLNDEDLISDEDVVRNMVDRQMMRRPWLWPQQPLFLKRREPRALGKLAYAGQLRWVALTGYTHALDLSGAEERMGGLELIDTLIEEGWVVD